MKLFQSHQVFGIYFTGFLLAGIGSVSAATRPLNMESSDPAQQEVMKCETPIEFSDRHQLAAIDMVPDPAPSAPVIRLVRSSQEHYDVLVGDDSVTAMGKLSGMQEGANPVHLVLETTSGMEHFLFMQNTDGSGEMLWSSATASALTTCVAAN